MNEEHLPYLYAGYRAGVFRDCDDIPDGLSPPEFDELMGSLLGNAMHVNGILIVLKADAALKKGGEVGRIPIGVVAMSLFQNAVYPHVYWMPWASGRNKMESAIRFIRDLNKEQNVIIISTPEWKDYYSHLGKYGILRKVGILRNHIGPGEDATLFQGVR